MIKGLESLTYLKENHRLPNEAITRGCVENIEKDLKALNEILVLYDKWLGNEMSDFEFFTLLNEITSKYDLFKEAGL